jgi:phage terminase large subunit-like protein
MSVLTEAPNYEDMTDEEALVYLDALETRHDMAKQSPITFYEPHAAQVGFHASRAFLRVLLGGNRAGKSTCGWAEDYAHVIGYRPWLPEDHPDYWVLNNEGERIRVPNTGRVICESYNKVEEVFYGDDGGKVKEWTPPSMIEHVSKNQLGTVTRIRFSNGSVVHFMTYNQKPKEFEGYASDWTHYDEPPPRDIYVANQRSLIDRSGTAWMTMTLVYEPWISEDIISKEGDDESDVEIFNLPSKDNPHLSPKALKAYFSQIKDPQIRRAREKGEPLHLQGRVFDQWHARPPYFIEPFRPKSHWMRIMGIDPHPQKPIAASWIAISSRTGIWYNYRELFDPEIRTIEEFCDRVKEEERGEHVSFRIIDASSQEKERGTGKSIREQIEDQDLFCEIAQKQDKLGRINLLKEMLLVCPVFKTPKFVVMRSCPRARHEFMTHVWGRHGTRIASEEKDPKAEVRAKDNDMLDIFQYLLQWGEKPEAFGSVEYDEDDEDQERDTGVIRQAKIPGRGGY